MPTHHQLAGFQADLDNLLWAAWRESGHALARILAPQAHPSTIEAHIQATFATHHPEVNERRALRTEGYTAPAPGELEAARELVTGLRSSALTMNEDPEPRDALYAQRQAMRAVTPRVDPELEHKEGWEP